MDDLSSPTEPTIVCTGSVSGRPSPTSDENVSPQVLKLRQFGRKRRSQSVPPPPPAAETTPVAMWSRADLVLAKTLEPAREPAAGASPRLSTRWPRTRRFFGFPPDPFN